MNKKAALEMSVQSIVIFVLTFIVVGLIITLIVSLFDSLPPPDVIMPPLSANPSQSKPLAVPGDLIILRTNKAERADFGIYLSSNLNMGETLTLEIVRKQGEDWVQGTCEGFDGASATLQFTSKSTPAPTNMNAGEVMGIRLPIKTTAIPGTYTCFMNVRNEAGEVLSFGSFALEVKS